MFKSTQDGSNDLPQLSGAVAGAPACHSIWSDVYIHHFTAGNSIFTKREVLFNLYSVLYTLRLILFATILQELTGS